MAKDLKLLIDPNMVLIAEVGSRPDQEQSIIFVNDAFERRSGYRRAELLGHPLRRSRAVPALCRAG